MDRRVKIVVLLMKDGVGRALTITELAPVVNLSPSRLQHLFKSETGTTLTQYHRMLRMEKARTLLETTFLNVKQIMLCVGARDRSHFERDFKRAYGLTPSKYRASTEPVVPLYTLPRKLIAESAIKQQ